MIKNIDKFICPVCGNILKWPEAYCNKCKKNYLLFEISNSVLIPLSTKVKVYDFRQNDADIERDRDDFFAHLKIIEGLYHFEEKYLKRLNFRIDIHQNDFRKIGVNKLSKTKVYYKYFRAILRNYIDLIKFVLSGKYSKKMEAKDSVQSSLFGYSKTYEMISSFVTPNWLGFLNGKITIDGVIQHHYDNMEILGQIIKDWSCKELLEFGMGSGVNILLLKKFLFNSDNLKISGFDYAISRLLTAKATFTKHSIECEDLFLANGLNLPLKDNSYDIVFSNYVIEQMNGFEEQALDNMIRVARKGVILFETAVYRPTIDQYVYMKHSGYSRDLPKILNKKRDIEVLKIENIKKSRFFGCPNVLFVLKKIQH